MEQELNLSEWSSVGQDMLTEKEDRSQDYKSIISFGVRFLDCVFRGILPSDVVLLGAKTGGGKTELVSTIASNAIESGKRVAMFALEAEAKEISRRIKYRHISKEYYSNPKFWPKCTFRKLNFVDWEAGDFDDLLSEVEEKTSIELSEKYQNMIVRYKKERFDVDDLRTEMISVKDKVDFIILDHVHYIDLAGDNENKELTDLIHTIRQVALVIKKPVIVVAHVRKTNAAMKILIPDIEDFHGSSNLSKICTKALMIAPAYDQEHKPTLFPTYMRVCKFRKDGSRTRFVALLNFDIATNSYEKDFQLGTLDGSGSKFSLIDDESKLPYWAKKIKDEK